MGSYQPLTAVRLLSPEVPWTPVPGRVVGEVKLSISYKSDKLFIMVMHIRGLVGVRNAGHAHRAAPRLMGVHLKFQYGPVELRWWTGDGGVDSLPGLFQ